MTTDLLSRGGAISNETDEKARRAVKAFRSLQPTLSAYARVLSGKKNVRVEMAAQDNGSTDGTRIYFRPPLALGDKTPHERRLCNKRNESGLMICPACAIREEVLVTIYHEIAHICFESFSQTTDDDKTRAIQFAIREAKGKWANAITERIESAPVWKTRDYINLASLINEYLPFLVNALEDARVNAALFKARPGVRRMFDSDTAKVFDQGFEKRNPDGTYSTVNWHEAPLNSQAMIGCFCKASGYNYQSWFHPKVVSALADTELTALLRQMETIRSAGAVYNLSFKVLARLRELGFCGTPQDPDFNPESENKEQDDGQPKAGEEGTPDSDSVPPESSDSGEPESSSESDESTSDDDSSQEGEEVSGESSNNGSADTGQEESETGSDTNDGSVQAESDGNDQQESDSRQSDSSVSEGDGDSEDTGDASQVGNADSSETGDSDSANASSAGAGDSTGETSRTDVDEDSEGQAETDSDSDESRSADGSDSRDSSQSTRTDEEVESTDGDSSRSPMDEEDNLDESDPATWGEGDLDHSDLGGSEGMDSGRPDSRESREESGSPDSSGSEVSLETDTSDSTSENEQPTEDSDNTEPVDTGADDGYGGTQVLGETEPPDEPDMGAPEDVRGLLEKWGDHEEKPKTTEVQEAEGAVDKAIIQGIYFTKPSTRIYGVREHFYGQPMIDKGTDYSQAWASRISVGAARRLGASSETAVPEKTLQQALIRMRRAFTDNQRGARLQNKKSGRINSQVLGRRAWSGDARLFEKNILPGKKNYFVVIGMDISGSTVGRNLALEKRAIMAQAELLDRVGIPFSIYAHTGNYHDGYNTDLGLDLEIYHIKDPDENWTSKTKERLETIGPSAANLDGHALEFLRKICDTRTETDRIIMYYSDGKMPAENHDEELEILTHEIKICRQKNYTLLGVGIRTDSPARHGLDTVEVHEDTDLIKVVKHLGTRLSDR